MKKERDISFDIIKLMTIYLVIYGHCIQYFTVDGMDSNIYKFIYLFHMSLFMMISGYFYLGSIKRHSLKDLIILKSKSLLIPCVTAELVLIPIWSYRFSGDTLFYSIYYGCWFLKTLFICSLICISFRRGILWGGVISVSLCYIFAKFIPLDINQNLLLPEMLTAFLFGILLRIIKDKINFFYLTPICLFVVAWLIITDDLDFHFLFPTYTIRHIIVGLLISFLFIVIFQLVCNRYTKKRLGIITKYGCLTKEIYVLQYIFLENILALIYPLKRFTNEFFQIGISFALLVIFIWLSSHIQANKKLNLLMGNKININELDNKNNK